MWRSALLTLILCIGLSTGCHNMPSPAGQDLSSGGHDMTSVTADQACAAFAAAFCNKLLACDPHELTLTYGDMATCVMRRQINCPLRFKVMGTPSALLDCANAYPAAACGDIFQNNPPMACRPAAGALDSNAVCGLSGQCKSSYCPIDPNTGCGQCLTRQPTGGTCSRNEDCDYGLVCPILAGATTGKCSATLGTGAACSVDIRCKWGLYCSAGKCAMPLGLGQDCSVAACDTEQGQFCNASKKCAAYTYATAGAMCGALPAGDTPCQAGAVCNIATGAKTGTCVAPVMEGGSCSADATMFKSCMQPADCAGGTCKVPDPTLCH